MSLLEFTLAVLLVAVLVVIAFERMSALQADMERAAVRHTVAAMREALSLEFARLVTRGELGRVDDYAGGNALALLSPPPRGYVGARGAGMPAPGTWFYEPAAGAVAYRARFPDALADEPAAAGDILRWRVVPRRRDSDGDGRYDDRHEAVYGLALEPAAR